MSLQINTSFSAPAPSPCLNKPQELLDQLRQWKLVERRIAALPDPLADTFRLSKDETPALTQVRGLLREAVWVGLGPCCSKTKHPRSRRQVLAVCRGLRLPLGTKHLRSRSLPLLTVLYQLLTMFSQLLTVSVLQWMRSAEWGPQEDSMLMLGAWRHGNNAWDK